MHRNLDNEANVKNPNNPAGGPGRFAGFRGNTADRNNHANQKNPNNQRFQGHQPTPEDQSYERGERYVNRDNHARQLNPNNPRY